VISSHLVSSSGFILLGAPIGIVIALLRSWRTRDGWWRLLVRIAMAIYAAVLIGLVFFPLPLPPWHDLALNPGLYYGPWPLPWGNLTPFATIGSALSLGPDWPQFWILLGNIAAFVPLGVFVGLTWPERSSWRRAFVLSLAATVAIEATQLGLSLLMGYPYRNADIDDVIVNTAGGLLGYGLFVVANLAGRAFLPPRLVFWASRKAARTS
jgi:glycopeptide antibiotics resistance protein